MPITDTSEEADAATQFATDTAGHEMTVLHDDGLYRHLHFRAPNRNAYWFDIVTWPGSLAVRGDMGGGYVFSRTTDMFELFRRPDQGINADYWAEKLPRGRASVSQYSEQVLLSSIERDLTAYEQEYPARLAKYQDAKTKREAMTYLELTTSRGSGEPVEPESPSELRQQVAERRAIGLTADEVSARDLLRDLEDAGVVSGTWEWDLTGYPYEFLWFCHAIVWGIRQYDATHTPPPERRQNP